jgi:uncharacterized protein (DUF488 family)
MDVRAFPFSRRYPHFSKESLEVLLPARSVRYTHFPELGGRRKPRPDSRNSQWRNAGFRAYADYMETPEFATGLDRMLQLAAAETAAIMCAEAVPWRCHRTLIADAVAARDIQVFHILDSSTARHTLTSFARMEDSRVRYDAPATVRPLPAVIRRAGPTLVAILHIASYHNGRDSLLARIP